MRSLVMGLRDHKKALWGQNPVLAQMIGLCPLLAVSTQFANALVLGLCTLLVLSGASALIALLRYQIKTEVRLPIFVLLIAGLTTVLETLLQLLAYPFYLSIGLFVPLITTNCLLLARAESYASKNTVTQSLLDSLFMGFGFLWVLLIIGAMREWFGQGSLFVGMADILPFWTWVVRADSFTAIGLLALPPGGFFVLGLLLASHRISLFKKAARSKRANAIAVPAHE